jgi:hypothetical protein
MIVHSNIIYYIAPHITTFNVSAQHLHTLIFSLISFSKAPIMKTTPSGSAVTSGKTDAPVTAGTSDAPVTSGATDSTVTSRPTSAATSAGKLVFSSWLIHLYPCIKYVERNLVNIKIAGIVVVMKPGLGS